MASLDGLQLAHQHGLAFAVHAQVGALGPAVDVVAQPGQGPAQGSGAGIAGAEAGQHQHRLAIAGGQLAMAQATQQVTSVGQHGPAFSQ